MAKAPLPPKTTNWWALLAIAMCLIVIFTVVYLFGSYEWIHY